MKGWDWIPAFAGMTVQFAAGLPRRFRLPAMAAIAAGGLYVDWTTMGFRFPLSRE